MCWSLAVWLQSHLHHQLALPPHALQRAYKAATALLLNHLLLTCAGSVLHFLPYLSCLAG
jgi:hypothetical protein